MTVSNWYVVGFKPMRGRLDRSSLDLAEFVVFVKGRVANIKNGHISRDPRHAELKQESSGGQGWAEVKFSGLSLARHHRCKIEELRLLATEKK
ncbi:hypothetical protein E2C01_051044 [Portunus trituberculatus]|uniref:Uncharacterized protein n=1 Tax=Portunus trituberculatus TaxID=210409 RepID=A0A5B7GDQ0_PORTR|nr:hypothetical protein [Portunus trituberculatus]